MPEGLPAKRVRRSKAEQRAESLEQILDAAEYLFSMNGLHGVTLRDVAQRVGVHTTLHPLLFRRQAQPVRRCFRAGALTSPADGAWRRWIIYEAEAGDKPTVEGALHAFLDTDLRPLRGGWRALDELGAPSARRVSNTPEGALLMDAHFDPVVLKLDKHPDVALSPTIRKRTSSGATTS